MKISNEIKIGAVTLIVILVFIWLFNFLKGKDYFKKTAIYYSVYNEIGGLAESSPVEINGYKVGVVQSINFIDAETGRLLVEFSVTKDFKLPVNTVAEITPVSIIAGMKVQFVYGQGPGFYSDGDTIPGRLAQSITTKLETELVPVKDRVNNLLTVLDSVITSVNEIMDPDFRKNLVGTMDNLNRSSESLAEIIGSRERDLKATIESLTRFTQMLSDNSEKMSSTFSNIGSITDTLIAADIYNSVSNLKAGLENTSLLLENLNEGKGSAGKLLTDDSLYKNLSQSLNNLNNLLEDMKANPKRYVHFSIFGKKNIPSE
jgi:phospholipid/cholesterol/gamma-HCH transport system substrate-binding protein